MKLSAGLEWALHCCVVLSVADQPVPVTTLAELHDVSSTYLAKQMQALSGAGIVASTQGRAGGYVLTKAPKDITVLDIVEAVDGSHAAYTCTEIRQRGPLAATPEACRSVCAINKAMLDADRAWRASLKSVTIADLARSVRRNYDDDVMGIVRGWLSDQRAVQT